MSGKDLIDILEAAGALPEHVEHFEMIANRGGGLRVELLIESQNKYSAEVRWISDDDGTMFLNGIGVPAAIDRVSVFAEYKQNEEVVVSTSGGDTGVFAGLDAEATVTAAANIFAAAGIS